MPAAAVSPRRRWLLLRTHCPKGACAAGFPAAPGGAKPDAGGDGIWPCAAEEPGTVELGSDESGSGEFAVPESTGGTLGGAELLVCRRILGDNQGTAEVPGACFHSSAAAAAAIAGTTQASNAAFRHDNSPDSLARPRNRRASPTARRPDGGTATGSATGAALAELLHFLLQQRLVGAYHQCGENFSAAGAIGEVVLPARSLLGIKAAVGVCRQRFRVGTGNGTPCRRYRSAAHRPRGGPEPRHAVRCRAGDRYSWGRPIRKEPHGDAPSLL